MDESAVAAHVERSEEILESAPGMDEATTKVRLIQPVLDDLLGWNLRSKEVELEYSVQVGSGTNRVDYALILGGTPVVFVEAKPASSDLNDAHEQQLKTYMRVVGVDWGMLTNGREFRILKRLTDTKRPEELSLAQFSLEEMPRYARALSVLSKDVIERGESEQIADSVASIRRATEALRSQRDEIAKDIENRISEVTQDTLPRVVEEETAAFLDRLIDSMDQESATGLIDSNGDSQGSGSTKTRGSSGVDSGKSAESSSIVGKIPRAEIEGPDDALVAVCATKKSGVEFLEQNNAWGFVRLNREPEYVAMYLTSGHSEVRYVGKVADIVPAREATLARPLESYVGDVAEFGDDKQVIFFEPGSLYELEDPIPYETKYPQGLRYSTLGALRTASTTDDFL